MVCYYNGASFIIKNMSRKKKKGKLTAEELTNYISQIFRKYPRKRLNARQIVRKLQTNNSKDAVQHALEVLQKQDVLIETRTGKFRLNKAANNREIDKKKAIGTVDMTQRGSAYIVCEGLETDIYVSPRRMGTAMNGDTVEVEYFKSLSKERLEGKVLNVIERAKHIFIGTIHISHRYAFVVPDDVHVFTDIYVGLEDIGKAKTGQKVVVKITKWPSKKLKSPVGKVLDILGKAGSSDIEMKSILIKNGFDITFPEAVQAESEALSDEITAEEIAKRKDFRPITTFTIDPATAKDFDDALSIRYLENGHCEVGVHIADVTHYVKAGSALDKEAYKRSTSVYLVDRVCPMLPEKLSNGVCSLRPNEDKLTFSAVFEFDKDDKVVKEWFGKTIIHSNHRFAYEDAQTVLETGEGDFVEELRQLNRIAIKLRKAKFKNGAINFDAPEVKFNLDEHGTPINLYLKKRKATHLLIEDFMLLANRRVATYIGQRENPVPYVYRVHDTPDLQKVRDFALFAKALGYPLKVDTEEQIAKAYNQLVKDAREREELRMLEPLAIRTMAKAEYTIKNIGHYGLGFKFYTHFTSPIRRYSDVLVHRLLEKNLGEKVYRDDKDKLEKQCRHISKQERKALDAERESIKYKQVEYMTNHIGATFDGRISGFLDKGVFVELVENFCEGLVSFDTLADHFTIAENRLQANGEYSGQVYKMGDRVKVRIVEVNLNKRTIDMELVEK